MQGEQRADDHDGTVRADALGEPSTATGAALPVTNGGVGPASNTGATELEQLGRMICERVEAARVDLTNQIKLNEPRDRQIEAMQSELERLRGDVIAKTIMPLINGVIQVHDGIGKLIDHHRSQPADTIPVDKVLTHLSGVQEDIVLALRDNGVELFSQGNADGDFDGRRQRVIGFVDTTVAEKSGKVAECVRPGFETDAGLVQKERVKVYRTTSST